MFFQYNVLRVENISFFVIDFFILKEEEFYKIDFSYINEMVIYF